MWWFPSGVTDKNNEQKISIQGGEEKSVQAPPIDGETCHRPPPLNCRNSTDKLVSDTSSIKNASTPSPQKNGQKGVIYFRSILPSDRSVIQVLHEEWFPVDYKDDFFDALCNERVMPVSGEPLHCCVACFKELSDIEFEEVKQMSVQGKPTGSLRSKRMISAICNNSKHPMLEGIGDFILWDHEYSVEKSNTRHHEYEVERMPTINGNEIHPATNTLPLLSTSNAPSYCIPTAEIANNINPEESLRESRARMQREKTERFYQNGFRFDDDEESKSSTIMDLNCSNHTSQSHNLNADECIVGCLVGSFLPSKTPSKRSGKLLEAQSDPRDETCKILIPDPDRHTRMF
eukprot:CAMPEP_0171356896 /NCGR_PEP_ID=MMETSP0878-20121228/45964_1 /TAXON_ID=67004 /ORGANISM="Thalassiosira weissflogii, Strain CCMP1336" /LENGTH=345 /DNA_ID=CAMNT_0011862927 /DNA_START=71 /DNA_END=1108 /DNA_ORIENTATION=+